LGKNSVNVYFVGIQFLDLCGARRFGALAVGCFDAPFTNSLEAFKRLASREER
jgi:hypothetical protein